MSGAERSDIHARCNLVMEGASSDVPPRDEKSKSKSIVKQQRWNRTNERVSLKIAVSRNRNFISDLNSRGRSILK